MKRERWETPDGDFLDLDWGPDLDSRAPIVLLLHGLEGSSRRRYVRSLARELIRRGVQPVAMNFRGCSGEPNRTARFYHSGETGDPGWVLSRIRERHPDLRLGAMGFSLGGNVLLKLLGEQDDGGRSIVAAAAVMSVPYDLAAGCEHLGNTRMGRIYSAYFMRSLKRKVAAKAELLNGAINVRAAAATRTIWEFDDVVTAPLAGFDDAAHYYRSCSSDRFLGGVGVPTLLVHSMDDPFLPPETIPVEQAEVNPRLTLSLQRRGGHVGFLHGSPWKPSFWADELVASFLAEQLGAPASASDSSRTVGEIVETEAAPDVP